MSRDYTQLPTYTELKQILASEGRRLVPDSKMEQHFVDFSYAIDLADSLGISSSFFSENIEFDELKDETLFHKVEDTFNSLITAILKAQNDTQKQTKFNILYDYLSKQDSLVTADIIFVFGSKQTFRMEKAIKLYKDGWAPKIMVSGRSPQYEGAETQRSEAEVLGEFAVECGIPEDDIILEKESITIPDNVKRSLNLLENLAVPHARIILVNSPFSQRRGWAHFSKFSNNDTELIRANVDNVSEHFSRDGWYKSEVGTKVVVKELFGLRVSTLLNTT